MIEPSFTLSARDPRAPGVVTSWAESILAAEACGKSTPAEVAAAMKAFETAREMRSWRKEYEALVATVGELAALPGPVAPGEDEVAMAVLEAANKVVFDYATTQGSTYKINSEVGRSYNGPNPVEITRKVLAGLRALRRPATSEGSRP